MANKLIPLKGSVPLNTHPLIGAAARRAGCQGNARGRTQ